MNPDETSAPEDEAPTTVTEKVEAPVPVQALPMGRRKAICRQSAIREVAEGDERENDGALGTCVGGFLRLGLLFDCGAVARLQAKKIRQKAGDILGVALDFKFPDGTKAKDFVKKVARSHHHQCSGAWPSFSG